MIRIQAPLRLGLGGGGTDLDEYSRLHGGYLVAVAIARYVRIQWPARSVGVGWEQLTVGRFGGERFSISSDVTGSSGLGSSGAIAAALTGIAVLRSTGRIDRQRMAEVAYQLERDMFTVNAGRQDTLVAVYGGLREYEIDQSGAVRTASIRLSGSTRARLQRELLLLDTGIRRSANLLLSSEAQRLASLDDTIKENLDRIKMYGRTSADLLRRGALDDFGELLAESWAVKRERTRGISTSEIDSMYDFGRRHGVVGGKVAGAGGGGFMMLYSRDPEKTQAAYAKHGLRCEPVTLDDAGISEIFIPSMAQERLG